MTCSWGIDGSDSNKLKLTTGTSPSGGTELIAFTATGIGMFGVSPVGQSAAYTPTNVTPDRAFDADTVAVAELADVVGTLIADLQALGPIG